MKKDHLTDFEASVNAGLTTSGFRVNATAARYVVAAVLIVFVLWLLNIHSVIFFVIAELASGLYDLFSSPMLPAFVFTLSSILACMCGFGVAVHAGMPKALLDGARKDEFYEYFIGFLGFLIVAFLALLFLF